MKLAGTEAEVRSVIHNKLQQAGWDPTDTSQIRQEYAFRGPQATSEDASSEELTGSSIGQIYSTGSRRPCQQSLRQRNLPSTLTQPRNKLCLMLKGRTLHLFSCQMENNIFLIMRMMMLKKLMGFISERLREDRFLERSKATCDSRSPGALHQTGGNRTLRPYQTDACS